MPDPPRRSAHRELDRRFFARPTLAVARDLVGCVLVHETPRGTLAGRIVETEAYIGEEDRACHARFGRTGRSDVLFGPPGLAYVYLIYGMYDLLNVVTEREGFPSAVLIRALEPTPDGGHAPRELAGPGKLTKAFGIDRSHNRDDLTRGPLRIECRRERRRPEIEASPRIGVSYAGEWALKPWRFTDPASTALSRPPRANRAAQTAAPSDRRR